MDWIGAASVGGIWAGSVGGLLLYLHTRNVKAKDEDRAEHQDRARAVNERFDRLDRQFSKVDTDMDGLTRQLGAVVTDVERRFLPRVEHAETITRLDDNIRQLNATIAQLNAHLFDLARNGRQG